MKAPVVLIQAVLEVSVTNRASAAKLAEKVFYDRLAILERFGDFSAEVHQQMAAEAAAAELKYRFNSRQE